MRKVALSFRSKIFLMTIPIVLLVIFIVTGSYSFLSKREQVAQIKKTGDVVTNNLNRQLTPLMIAKNYAPLSGFAQNLTTGDENVLYTTIQDTNGKIVAQSKDAEKINTTKSRITNIYSSDIYSVEKYFSTNHKMWIMETKVSLFKGADKYGSILIGYGHELVTRGMNQAVKIGLFTAGLGMLISIGISFLTSNFITRPIKNFIKDIRIISSGNLSHKVIITSKDEIGQMAVEFNDLTENLKNTLSEKDDYANQLSDLNTNLEEKVRDRTQALEKSNQEVSKAYNELQSAQAQLVQSEKMASLGQLVAGIAHEVNNPISFIYGNMDHLDDYIKDIKEVLSEFINLKSLSTEEKQKMDNLIEEIDLSFLLKDLDKLIKSCKNGAERTKDIVTSLRSFSRLDEADIKHVDIHEGINSTLEILTHLYKNRINVHKNYGNVPKIQCYAGQLNQVFMNLLSNAAQAIEDKGDVWIETQAKGSNVIISFKDNGKGISEEDKIKLFTPFFTTKPVGEGTGLGLSISYGIIEKHNGRIWAESEEGVGTTFHIEIPVEGAKDDSIAKT